jgi:hypothetical protein
VPQQGVAEVKMAGNGDAAVAEIAHIQVRGHAARPVVTTLTETAQQPIDDAIAEWALLPAPDTPDARTAWQSVQATYPRKDQVRIVTVIGPGHRHGTYRLWVRLTGSAGTVEKPSPLLLALE